MGEKEKIIKQHTRKTKSGKTVIVRKHTAKYDSAEEAKKSILTKKGSGDELLRAKKTNLNGVEGIAEMLESIKLPSDKIKMRKGNLDFSTWTKPGVTKHKEIDSLVKGLKKKGWTDNSTGKGVTLVSPDKAHTLKYTKSLGSYWANNWHFVKVSSTDNK